MEDDGGAESAMAEGFAPCRLQLEQTLCSNTNTEDETSIGAGAESEAESPCSPSALYRRPRSIIIFIIINIKIKINIRYAEPVIASLRSSIGRVVGADKGFGVLILFVFFWNVNL